MPYNKLLTNLASSSRTEEYWPSVVFVRTGTTSGQYSPVRPSHSVSKKFMIIYRLVCEQALLSRMGRRESRKKGDRTTFPPRPNHFQQVSSRSFQLSEPVHWREDGCMTLETAIAVEGAKAILSVKVALKCHYDQILDIMHIFAFSDSIVLC